MSAEPRHLDLVDRLRGQYHLPVNDGAGPLNGSMTFSREFKTPPIQHEAAAEIEKLRETLSELVDLMQGVIDGEYKPDSFTLQPARDALSGACRA